MQELLEEIEEERRKETQSTGQPMPEGAGDNSDIVLVACKDERSCLQLEECISKGQHQVPPYNHLGTFVC